MVSNKLTLLDELRVHALGLELFFQLRFDLELLVEVVHLLDLEPVVGFLVFEINDDLLVHLLDFSLTLERVVDLSDFPLLGLFEELV